MWGYELLTDIHCQIHILDPGGVLQGWSERLAQYPPALKRAIVNHYVHILNYWRDDYHYANKVRRQDVLFCQGLALTLINGMVRVLFALNEVYYVGDGNNLLFLRDFATVPDRFVEKVEEILRGAGRPESLAEQRELLVGCINGVGEVARAVVPAP